MYTNLLKYEDVSSVDIIKRFNKARKYRHPFICGWTFDGKKCGKKYARKYSLAQHIKAAHDGEKPYSCEHIVDGEPCGKKYLARTHLARHIKQKHLAMERRPPV
jgi:hypothetical protein